MLLSMLMSPLISLALLLAQPATAPSATDKAAAKAAIERFMAAPKMGDDAAYIDKFAKDSEDVTIALDDKVMTWMQHDPLYPQAELLNIAFIAGNVKSQLESGKNADDSYAGLLAAFKAYDKLRDADKDLKIPEIDKLIDMERQGELKDFIAKAAKDRDK